MRTLRLRTLACALLLACACAAVSVSPAAARARRPTATTCDITSVAGTLGPTSVGSLKVTNTTCAAGRSVVRAFHVCRLANGVSGRCVRYVAGYACGEIRSNGPTQFTSRVTCTKRRKKVVHTYTQSL